MSGTGKSYQNTVKMNKFLAIIFLLASLVVNGQTEIEPYLNEIKIDSLRSYIYNLSSTQMEGRATGRRGGKIAADYISSIFRRLELDSLNFNGYFQKFYITKFDTNKCTVQYKYSQDSLRKESMQAQNIISFIHGSQDMQETIIISAHYDHLGKLNDSTIYFGADDNASGIATIIEIARVMHFAAKNGIKPKRNIMFVAFDAEEKGMLGSGYFLNNIPNSIGNVVLNINLDMLGRNRHDEDKYNKNVFMISDGKNSRFYKKVIKQLNKSNKSLFLTKYPLPFSNIALKSDSDHYRFKEKGIPFVHLQTGMHKDYHTINDTPDKINYEKLTEISKLLCKSVWEIANADKNLIIKTKK